MMVKIEGTNFYRDTNTMALVNRDTASKDEYYLKRRLIESQKQEINTVKKEMESIKGDVLEIKQMMLQLLKKG